MKVLRFAKENDVDVEGIIFYRKFWNMIIDIRQKKPTVQWWIFDFKQNLNF